MPPGACRILVFTASLFVLFPRVGLAAVPAQSPARSGRMVGFSDHVDLGEHGALRSDPSIVRFASTSPISPSSPPTRMTLRPARHCLRRLRRARAWKRTVIDRQPAFHGLRRLTPLALPRSRARQAGDDRSRSSIDPAGDLPPAAHGGAPASRLQPLSPVPERAAHDPARPGRRAALPGGRHPRGLHYEAYLASARRRPSPTSSRRTSAAAISRSSSTLPERVAALAHTWADAQPSALLKAKALEDHLRHDYRYDTNSPSGGTPQPLDHFLFESRRGHCEFFSTAMAIMLRELGISSSRNVTGFVGGTYNRFGHYYAVREGTRTRGSRARSTTAPTPRGLTFDPTPAAGAQPLEDTTGAWVYLRDLAEALSQRWNRYVVGYDLPAPR